MIARLRRRRLDNLLYGSLIFCTLEKKKSHDTNNRIVGIKQEKEGGKRQKPKGAVIRIIAKKTFDLTNDDYIHRLKNSTGPQTITLWAPSKSFVFSECFLQKASALARSSAQTIGEDSS